MKIGKYLKFHFKCLETGFMPKDGLCNSIGGKIYLFYPTRQDHDKLVRIGEAAVFWGYGRNFIFSDPYNRRRLYTPLRQTIVLLMAAMNGEL